MTSEGSASSLQAEDLPDDIAGNVGAAVELSPIDLSQVSRLSRDLGVDAVVATLLARRGLADADSARQFLAADLLHDASLLEGVDDAAASIAAAVSAGKKIRVHGDYDVDGVCSTTILVTTLTRLGADVSWHVPSRFEEGYGLSMAAVEQFANQGVSHMIAVDCGVTAVDQIARAGVLGMATVVVDHHQPGDQLPSCPVVHPAFGDYPFAALCASAVAWKLARILHGDDGGPIGSSQADDLVDLVALGTVCDLMPLVDENRTLVRAGIKLLRKTTRPGIRELLQVARVSPQSVEAQDLGFRLGPRINAIGRMFGAEPAVELMLTADDHRAAELAAKLDRANVERRSVEQRVTYAAEEQARRQRDRYAIVVAAEGWHPGVLGIVAGRLAESFRRPAIALEIAGDVVKGSGRARGSYDLLAGLTACSDLLTQFGGHRAAAGLELPLVNLEEFRERFQQHAAAELTEDDLRDVYSVDAVVPPGLLSLEMTERLDQLGPFGMGNPEPKLLVPGVHVESVRSMGADNSHARFVITDATSKVSGVAFRCGGKLPVASGSSAHAVVRLSRNDFRGSVEAQVQLSAMFAAVDTDQYTRPVLVPRLTDGYDHVSPGVEVPGREGDTDVRQVIDARAPGALATLIELIAGDRHVAVVTRDVGGTEQYLASSLAGLVAPLGHPAVIDYRVLGEIPVAERAEHLIVFEPPHDEAEFSVACAGSGYLYWTWPMPDSAQLVADLTREYELRPAVTQVFKALRSTGGGSVGDLRAQLSELAPPPLTPDRLSVCLKVLTEIGVVAVADSSDSADKVFSINEGVNARLDDSPAYLSYRGKLDGAQQFLSQLTAGL